MSCGSSAFATASRRSSTPTSPARSRPAPERAYHRPRLRSAGLRVVQYPIAAALVMEPEPVEAEQGAKGRGKAVPGLTLEHLAEQDVAGVRAVEARPRREERRSLRRLRE